MGGSSGGRRGFWWLLGITFRLVFLGFHPLLFYCLPARPSPHLIHPPNQDLFLSCLEWS